MFPLQFQVMENPTGASTTMSFEALCEDLVFGRRSVFALCYELSFNFRPWLPALHHPSLRPFALLQVTSPSRLSRIEWVSPNGQPLQTASREQFAFAVQSGHATRDTAIDIYTTDTRFPALAHEILPPEQAGSWGIGKVLLAIAGGAFTAGAVVYGVQRYQWNHEIVNVRDPELRAEIYARDGGTCHLCGQKVSSSHFHLDHQFPRVRGGEHTRANLHTSHALCNQRKGAKTVEEFEAYTQNAR